MNWLALWCNWENGGISLLLCLFDYTSHFSLRLLMTWSSLICRGENLEKILLSNYALDHREIFSRKCSSNLSESNLRSINILVDQLYYARCYHLQCCFLCSLSSPYSTTWFQMSLHFFFWKKGVPDEFPFDELLVICCCLSSAFPLGFCQQHVYKLVTPFTRLTM